MSASKVSSDYLFHYTNTIDNLEKIIDIGVGITYSLEDFSFLNSPKTLPDDYHSYSKEDKLRWEEKITIPLGFPMSCFCDIPLDLIADHKKLYGEFAIGLKKEWGISNGINPLVYLNKTSNLATYIRALYGQMKINNGDKYEQVQYNFYKLLQFIKPYEGSFTKNGITYSNYRFYDEKEWRYVVPFPQFSLLREEEINIRRLNKSFEYYLPIESKDVVMVIVKDHCYKAIIQENKKIKDNLDIKVLSWDELP